MSGLSEDSDRVKEREGSFMIDVDELVTRKEADTILKEGYPNANDLNRFPLSHLLASISDVDPRYGRQEKSKLGHIEKVMNGMNILLSQHPERIVEEWAVEKPFQDAVIFEQAYQKIFGNSSEPDGTSYCRFSDIEERNVFFRLLALYHDIGKAIIVERHPMVGWHLVKDVFKPEVEKFLYPLVLGRDYNSWLNDYEKSNKNIDQITNHREQQMLKIFGQAVRFHDYFGVLSTGEGSLPLMLDLISLRGMIASEAQEIFSTMMILNLADVYGSVNKILPQKINAFCDDWQFLCNTIASDCVHGDRALFFNAIRDETQNAKATIKRLWRLMYEGAPDGWRNEISFDAVEEIFREATLSRMYPFINNYAVFCKLDYCLGYKIMLMNSAEKEGMQLAVPVNSMIGLLAELEKRYGDLCKRPDGTWRRIGFEMAGLTRKPTTHKKQAERSVSKIGETITNLLLQPGGLGKEWAVSECTVWFMEE